MTLLVLCVTAGWVAIGSPRSARAQRSSRTASSLDEPGGIRVSVREAFLEVRSEYHRERVVRLGADDDQAFTFRNTALEERIGVGVEGDIYHPDFFAFEGSIEAGARHEWFYRNFPTERNREYEAGPILEYDLRADIFRDKAVSASVLGRQLERFIPREFRLSQREILTDLGAEVRYRSAVLPMRPAVEQFSTDIEGIDRDVPGESRDESTFNYEAAWQPSRDHRLSLDYEYLDRMTEQLYVTDTGGQVVHRFDLRDRGYQALFEISDRRLSMPVGVAGDVDGIVYVADADHRAIHRFGPAGRYLSDLPCDPLVRPAGVCVDDERERIYIADVGAHRVLCFDKQGQLILSIGQRGPEPGRFNFPIHVALDGAGRLLVVDAFNHRIQRFRPDGTLDLVFGRRGTAPGDFALPKAVAVDREGHIYVVDARFENVQVFDADGELLIGFGEEGSGPGEFWLPGGICIDNQDRIFVADSYNRRVQVFKYLTLEETPILGRRENSPSRACCS